MPTQDLNTLDGSQAWWQELRNRIADAHTARSQTSQVERDVALKALKVFRDYPRLPHYPGLRQYAVDAIADFLLDDIDAALNGLGALEHEIQSGAQQELHTARFVTEAFRPRQHLLRALTSLVALQSYQSSMQIISGQSLPSAHRKKIDQAVQLVGELLTQSPALMKADAKSAGVGIKLTLVSKKKSKL